MAKMSEFRLYWRYLRMQLLAGVEYKGWFLMVLQTALTVVTDPIGTIFMFSRFGSIGAWSVERILLIYAMAVTSYGLAETFARGFDYFPWRMVQNGDFDRVLLRPRSTYVQVAGSVFHIHRIARPFTGLIAILWCLLRLGVSLSAGNLLLLLYALAGGFVMYVGVYILTSGISFFSVKGLNWIYLFTNVGYQVTRCPVEMMPRPLWLAFTFLLPILVVSYYPASAICGWGEPLWKGLLALPAGALFLCVSTFVWRFGTRHYNSTGS